MRLTARQRKRRAYAESLPRAPRAPRPERPARPAPASAKKPVRRSSMPPLFYFLFGGFGCLYALYYLGLLVVDALGHPHDSHGKPLPPPGTVVYVIAVAFLLLSIGNIYLGVRERRARRGGGS